MIKINRNTLIEIQNKLIYTRKLRLKKIKEKFLSKEEIIKIKGEIEGIYVCISQIDFYIEMGELNE